MGGGPPFLPKNRVYAFLITNLDHLFGLAYPENLSSIGLMIEAVDTFCGTSAGAVVVPVPGVIMQKTSA